MREKTTKDLVHSPKAIFSLWPLFLVVPSYTILSLLQSKVPWVVICLSPAWATLQGIAMAGILCLLKKFSNGPSLGTLIAVLASGLVIAGSTVATWKLGYEQMLQHIDMGQWRGAHYSRNIAQQLNRIVSDRERILITSFHYWKGLGPGHACPVFAYYFKKKTEILMRPHENTYDQLESDIKKYRIDWTVLSPEPSRLEREILPGFINNHNLSPVILEKAVIFKTTAVYRKEFK